MSRGEPDSGVEAVRADVACPTCGYNLRGLRGSIVDCPECGTRCDIAQLINRQWTLPWWKAPGFNAMVAPAAVLYLGCLVAGPASVILTLLLGPPSLTFAASGLAWALAVLALWAWAMVGAWRRFGDRRGVLLPLLAHLLVAAMAGGIAGLAVGGFVAVAQAVSMQVLPALAGAIVVAIGILLVILARSGERFIAEHCIRRYLEAG